MVAGWPVLAINYCTIYIGDYMKTETGNSDIGKLILRTAATLLILLALIYLYTLLHEGGHALVAIMYGGKIESFVLGFDAHITTSGANFTPLGEALFSAAGVLLPALSLAVALKLYNRNSKSRIYHYLYAVFTIMVISSFLAWVAIPLISVSTEPPAGDDVSKFLKISGLNPLLISLLALLVMFLLALSAYKRGLYSKTREHLNALSQTGRPKLNKRQTICLVLAIVILGSVAFGSYQMLLPDKVFTTSFSLDITAAREDIEIPFKVETSKSYNMNLKLDAEGLLTDVQIYDDKGSLVYQNIGEWFTLSSSLDSEPGDYLFSLTFLRDPEAMVQHFAEKGYWFPQEQIDELKEVLTKNRDHKSIPVSFSAVIQ